MSIVQQHESPTLRWRLLGETVLILSLPGEIPNPVWDEYIGVLTGGSVKRVLSLTVGEPVLSATRRKAAADALKASQAEAVVVTDNRITRGVITAVTWLGVKGVRAFSWSELDAAIAASQFSPQHAATAKELALDLQRRGEQAGLGR